MNKVVVITGASSGLGLSHAIYLTYKGYTVFGTSRRNLEGEKDTLKESFIRDHTKWRFTNREKTKVKAIKNLLPKKILKNLDELIDKITFFKMDVTKDDYVKTAIDEMENKAKKINGRGIDVLINNAGISYFKSAEDLSLEEWQINFDTNFFGPLRVIKAILPSMRVRKTGQIINTSSLGAYISIPFQSHYSASKSAIKVLSEGLRIELKQFNIKVSSIIPSDINTDFNVNMLNLTKSHNQNFSSTDISEMIANTPTEKNSPYYESIKRAWKIVVKNLIVSPPPLVVSKKISKILRKRRPKVNYKSGSLAQIFLVFLIRRIVSDEITDWLMPKYYGL
ncbi:MAG: SDR family oxidoreductase [Asgard group archaeon]|nr:SDR family oxidoreductase [Asgard group archaeon]